MIIMNYYDCLSTLLKIMNTCDFVLCSTKKTRKRQMELHDEHNTVMSVVYDMNH